jgi:hypothetical protein
MDFFITSGDHTCEECGDGIYADDVDNGKGQPILFDVECEEHGDRQVIFHENCMPPEFAAAYENLKRAEKAHLN